MSGPLILGTNSIKDTGYNVDNSIRFDDGSGDELTRSQSSSPSSQRLFTFSAWVKRGNINNDGGDPNMQLFSQHNNTSDRMDFRFQSGGTLDFRNDSPRCRITTNRLFRDSSAWYHVVIRVDTTQSTASNRLRLYINGVQETSFSSADYGDQNDDLITNASTFDVGDDSYGTGHFDGLMCEVVYCDGQSLDPTSFGEFDEDSPNIWKPIDVSGLTFGNNGFYLDFKDSSALGADVSGNSNNFTVNNLTAVDQSTDTCTNNFATLNPLATGSLVTLSEGNLKALGNNGSDSSTSTATIGITGGKFYWEAKIINTVSGYPYFGIYKDFDSLVQGNLQGQATGDRIMIVQANASTTVVIPGTDLTITAPANNDIIMFAVDRDNNKFYLGVNGTWYNSGNPTSGATGTGSLADLDADGVVMFGTHHYNASAIELNFGSPSFTISSGNSDANGYGNFEYAVPSGYFSLCTKNIAEHG